MFTIEAISPNGAVEIELNPLPTRDALAKVVTMRREGFQQITLRDVSTGVRVDIGRFVKDQPDA
ncbi:MAG: hypothetical protein ACOY5Y_12180 [Pseudomonadota bacterium]